MFASLRWIEKYVKKAVRSWAVRTLILVTVSGCGSTTVRTNICKAQLLLDIDGSEIDRNSISKLIFRVAPPDNCSSALFANSGPAVITFQFSSKVSLGRIDSLQIGQKIIKIPEFLGLMENSVLRIVSSELSYNPELDDSRGSTKTLNQLTEEAELRRTLLLPMNIDETGPIDDRAKLRIISTLVGDLPSKLGLEIRVEE